jgi:hypothetical protein
MSGTDLPGNDISGTPVSGSDATPQWCMASCCATPGCVAFTFVQSQPGAGVPYCWLKHTVSPQNPLSDAVSGVLAYSTAAMSIDGTQSSLRTDVFKQTYLVPLSSALSTATAEHPQTLTRVPEDGDGGADAAPSCPSTVVQFLDMPGADITCVALLLTRHTPCILGFIAATPPPLSTVPPTLLLPSQSLLALR